MTVLLFLALLFFFDVSSSLRLFAPFDSGGLRGNISFAPHSSSVTIITVDLVSSTDEADFEWTINEFPAFLDTRNPCATSEVGKAEHALHARHGVLRLSREARETSFEDTEVRVEGVASVWGRSVTLRSLKDKDQRACANIMTDLKERTSAATFAENGLAGHVLFRENERGETYVFSNLFHTADEYRSVSRHDWRILVTDVIDTKRERKCEYLQTLLDPSHVDDEKCSASDHANCKMGDLTRKLGPLVVGSGNNRYSKKMALDLNLQLSTLGHSRALYLVVQDKKRVLGCARVYEIEPREAEVVISGDGVKGKVRFRQRSRTDPTEVSVELQNLRGRAKWYRVHHRPVPDRFSASDDLCSPRAVGPLFNPFGVNASTGPETGRGTSDQFAVGDLSGKYGALSEDQSSQDLRAIFRDSNLALFGPNNIIGRSLVLHKGSGERWLCANIISQSDVLTAEATFVYPVVGRVRFTQFADQPMSETQVLAELSYADGSHNHTRGHNWRVHWEAHGRDFYNWSRRCESAGQTFNPFGVGLGRNYATVCSEENPLRCQVGDLSAKAKKLTIAAVGEGTDNRLFYWDTLLPLSGPHSIIGRSLVIYDDSAPVQRGDRMACAVIRRRHLITAVARSWRSTAPAIPVNVSGSLVFRQQQHSTQIQIQLRALSGLASGYHVHEVSVPVDKEFACSEDAVYGHFNPFSVDVTVGPAPEVGSLDQYEVGDLSGKFGTLDGLQEVKRTLSDPTLELTGVHSVIGRSVVIHKREKNRRWVCSTIEPEKSKEVAKEWTALASFDDPRHLITGYVRLKQWEYSDGGLSDTWLEVSLRYGGVGNRNVTASHKWSVFVSGVGEDAFNTVDSVRCLAAGYLWNPFLVEVETKDCSSRNPLRCAMGDLSGRHGTLQVGAKRRVMSDPNLPLTGNYSVINRSLLVFKPDNNQIPIACANIKIDATLKSSIGVKKTNSAFTVQRFMDHMRQLLNTTEWLVKADVSQTKDQVANECVQLSVSFSGAEAQRLQLEFSNLINLGTIRRQTRTGLQSVSTYYKPCRSLIDPDNGSANSRPKWTVVLFAVFQLWFVFVCDKVQ